MKCKNCGAEVHSKFCEYCGSEAPQEKPVINIVNNYYGSNDSSQASRPDSANAVSPQQVYTENRGKNLTWLWVLGWIFVYPVPLTVILMRKDNMKSSVKIAIIIASWIMYFILAIFGSFC